MHKFFIVGLGRSGTAWLAQLLARDPHALVHHEPDPFDVKILSLRYAGRFNQVVDGLLEERFRRLLPSAGSERVYGEVNSYLRYETEWLQQELAAEVIHIVRDGRAFVRSAYERVVYTEDEVQLPIVPGDDDPYSTEWNRLNRFERLCWYWRHTNQMLIDRVASRVKLEDLLDNYDILRTKVLRPTRVEVSEAEWSTAVNAPANTASSNRRRRWVANLVRGRDGRGAQGRLPSVANWSPAMHDRFWEICGPTMEDCGYTR